MDRTHLLPDAFAELVAQRFRALGDPMRLKLLDLLRDGELSVQELTRALDATSQNVSKHLGVLYGLGIVRRRKSGNFVYYSIADAAVFALCQIVCGSIEAQLDEQRVALLAEAESRQAALSMRAR